MQDSAICAQCRFDIIADRGFHPLFSRCNPDSESLGSGTVCDETVIEDHPSEMNGFLYEDDW